jgi:Tol biopolymer transport system component
MPGGIVDALGGGGASRLPGKERQDSLLQGDSGRTRRPLCRQRRRFGPAKYHEHPERERDHACQRSQRRGADTEIAIIHVKSGSKWRITDNSYNDLYPAWSPDGTEIVFANQSDPTTNDLYTIKRDGSGLRQLTDSSYNEVSPAWSPDGTKIAFERGGVQELWTMDVDGSNPKNLTGTDTGSGGAAPDWSPDGTKIAFRRDVSGEASDIYVVRPDGTGLRNITKTPLVYEGDPAWSSNGRRIAFLRNDPQTSRNDIWTVRAADGSDPVQVTDTPRVAEYAPTWQPTP